MNNYERAAKEILYGDNSKTLSMQKYVNRYFTSEPGTTRDLLRQMCLYNAYLIIMKDQIIGRVTETLGENASYEDIYTYLDENWNGLSNEYFGIPEHHYGNFKGGEVFPMVGWEIVNIHDGVLTVGCETERVEIDCVHIPFKSSGWLLEHFLDPDSAERVCRYSNNLDYKNPRYFSECLYKTRNDHYFIFGEGGPLTKYKYFYRNGWVCGGCELLPLTSEEAQEWIDNHGLDYHLEDCTKETDWLTF